MSIGQYIYTYTYIHSFILWSDLTKVACAQYYHYRPKGFSVSLPILMILHTCVSPWECMHVCNYHLN